MNLNFVFFFNSILLGIGLAMDAFSVSLANGLNEPCMKPGKMCFVAGIFAVFQALMPMLGWICIHTIAQRFTAFQQLIPWIALILLGFIGGKMLKEGIENKDCQACSSPPSTISALLLQGIATSIDALSVGFTISDYRFGEALLSACIIACVTFIICFGGLLIGKKAGVCLAGKSGVLGGLILILIGLEIFITNLF